MNAPASHQTLDSRNFAIGVLSITAVILLVALLIVQTLPSPALASGMTVTAGPYILTVGTDLAPDEELLYVIDTPSQRLVSYRFDPLKYEIQIVQGIELDKLRGAATQTQPVTPNQPAPRRP